MTLLFSSERIGDVEIQNRFVHSATFEAMADENGKITEKMIKRYRDLAKAGVGLIIPGMFYVHPLGQSIAFQASIYSDEMVPGLRELVDAVHAEGSKIAFQLNHGGRQTSKELIGQTPIGASSKGWDPTFLVKPREMTEDDIWEVVEAFGKATRRAAEAGVDGVQLHAAHGYLINQFLSPFFNIRNDEWGGSEENRFRFLKEIVLKVKDNMREGMFLSVKLNGADFTFKEGIAPVLAARYAGWLADLEIDALEVSCGTSCFSFMNMIRGEVPIKELVEFLPMWQKPFGWLMMRGMVGRYDLEEGYNLEAAKVIKPGLGDVSLMLVGGLRRASHMEEILQEGHAEFISMSRPLIKEPSLVRKFREGKSEAATCVSCNKCFAAVVNGMPLRCYGGSLGTGK
jgi:2,4-dienoyl-CoA reductase-like NADH-dependent reductase (Old Yellow Enzyme family)